MKWQKTTRLAIVLVGLAVAVGVGLTMKKRTIPQVKPPVTRTDPKAVLESAEGQGFRINRSREEVRVEWDKMLTYPDGSNKMLGLKVTTERDGRTFVITGSEGRIGERESTVDVAGNVHVTASDGLEVRTDHVTFTETDGISRAPGPVEFSRGRMSGTGVGFVYDKNQNILTILDQAVVHVVADEKGAGAMDVTAGALEFKRNEKILRFDRTMKATRAREVIEADTAVAHLTEDEEHLQTVELRGQSRITAPGTTAGSLQALTGRDIDLAYGPDGSSITHALITGDAVIQLAGDGKQPGRHIAANVVEVSLAPDGATPTALIARENVRVNLPAEPNGVNRTIAAQTLESKGDSRQGLTSAHFAGNVQFAERGPDRNRAARSELLDVALKPGFSSIDEARFTRGVRFVDGTMTATSTAARYVLDRGTLELTSTGAGGPPPHVVNERIMVDAARMDVTLEGPIVKAVGSAKSVLQPQKTPDAGQKDAGAEIRMPSMLKQDQPVNVTADALDYDGNQSRATYTGNAQLWQGETLIKAPSLVIDSKKGDLSASGPVATVAILQQEGKDGRKERVRSVATAKGFTYKDEDRRATYTGDAHMSGPQGDMTAERIELFLKPSGDELERVEAYEDVTLRSDTQKTKGARLFYFDADGRYLVDGMPVTIVDECGRETTGRTLTFYKSTDRIVVDGNEQTRTQTKGKSNCPGT